MKATMISDRVGLGLPRIAVAFSMLLSGLWVGPVWADGQFPDPPKLKLTINTSTSHMTLSNVDALSVDIDLYEIRSNTGSLMPASWLSLQDQNRPDFPAGDGSGNGWEEFGLPSSHLLAEGFIFGDSTFAPETLLPMGLAFDPTIPDPSILFRYAVADGAPFGLVDGTLVDGIVQYVMNPPPRPDVNADGVVNIFDINWISAHWDETGPEGDANGDGTVNIFDVNLVSDNWTPTASATAVPEPATIALLLVGLLSWGMARAPRR
jgi:hypothetical protein